MQLNEQALIAILRGLMGGKTDANYVPMPTSSIMIEFYAKAGTASPFDRSNYYLKIFLDDTQL